MIKRTLAITLALCFFLSTNLHATLPAQLTQRQLDRIEEVRQRFLDCEEFEQLLKLSTRGFNTNLELAYVARYLEITVEELEKITESEREARRNARTNWEWDNVPNTVNDTLLPKILSRYSTVKDLSPGGRDWVSAIRSYLTPFFLELRKESQQLQLPNRRLSEEERNAWIDHYWYHGGPTEYEKEVVRLINEIRREHRLQPVVWCNNLGMAARFYTQQRSQLASIGDRGATSHHFGPYGGSRYVTRVFDRFLRGSVSSGRSLAQSIVDSWMRSTSHRTIILRPDHRIVGAGAFESDIPGIPETTYVIFGR